LSLCGATRRRTGTRTLAQVVIMTEDADLVIELDEPGIELLRGLAGPRSQFRVSKRPDGSISLHPMSAHDTELWQSGLVSTIVENFSSAEFMIRLKADKL
jgi:hypothetical protein